MARTGRSLRQDIFNLLGIFLPTNYSRFEYCMLKITNALAILLIIPWNSLCAPKKGRRVNTLKNILYIFLV